jgi:GNAT superfamily N-acetyltransferase
VSADGSPAVLIGAPASAQETEAVRDLFREYAESLGFSLGFQGFEKEMAAFPGAYAPPDGALLLARVAREGTWHDAGAVGLRPFAPGICEMKRMYVRPTFRGLGLARTLALTLIDLARTRGYRAMRLDTVPAQMRAAERLYRELGFVDIPPYYDSPLEAVYLERDLRS